MDDRSTERGHKVLKDINELMAQTPEGLDKEYLKRLAGHVQKAIDIVEAANKLEAEQITTCIINRLKENTRHGSR